MANLKPASIRGKSRLEPVERVFHLEGAREAGIHSGMYTHLRGEGKYTVMVFKQRKLENRSYMFVYAADKKVLVFILWKAEIELRPCNSF